MLKATLGLAGAIGLGLLVACSPQAPREPVAPTTAPQPPATSVPGKPTGTTTAPQTLRGTRIVGVFPSGSTFEPMYQQEAKDFEAATGIKLEYSSIPFENLMDREMTLVGAQSAEIDIFGTHYAQIGRFGDAMLPLNDLAARSNINADQFIKGSFDAFTIDGKLLALPLHFDMRALFYRTDLFANAGIQSPPTTLDELLKTAQKLNNPPDRYGYMIVGKADPALREFSDLLWGNGGDFLENGLQPSKPAWNQDAGVQALQWWRDLIYTQKVVPPGVPAYGWEENTALFASGQAAMNKDWGPFAFSDAKQSRIINSFSVAPLPVGAKSPKTTGVCHGRGINKFSKNQDAAWEFVKWLSGKEQQVGMFQFGMRPAHLAALQEVKDKATGVDRLSLEASLAHVNDAYTWPLFPTFSQIEPILWGEIEAVLSNQKPAKEGLDAAAEQAMKIFKDAKLI